MPRPDVRPVIRSGARGLPEAPRSLAPADHGMPLDTSADLVNAILASASRSLAGKPLQQASPRSGTPAAHPARRGSGPVAAAYATVSTTAEVLHHPAARESLLTEVERRRAARFRHEASRLDFVAAHLLVRLCAARSLGVAADDIELAQYCDECEEHGHGRPYVPGRHDVQVSLSHTRGVVAAAAGPAAVGVDVELLGRRSVAPSVLEQVLTQRELRVSGRSRDPQGVFMRQWVRKEALVKVGRTSRATMREVDLSGLPPAPAGSGTSVQRSRFEGLHVLDLADKRRGALASVVSAVPVLLTGEVRPPVPLSGR
ncbi:4'-phosphopantetheinyl transferase superfamily protein [Streptomyces californicus]|uniref:4'-phosphopantetheinyl transferase superfamily protein n=1 Tax=Streptomyces californicus TaxID=67351 RepID=A0ABD7CWP5_9ACTN|nr:MULTISPECIES: 4'-phosphopantetheinyl transferase family protein [Streptomyces]QRV31187.1 4'-phosphopantetheinyl transferase superfamily protein [Streptomyces californicus]QRV33203.1 4'-phosphopantetheinyl transferase superfamily protein [Streptomyces californicus]QRV44603.1 4'-phosphopantetheinyl transferase superfamily protein [Streptomyces californicus]QRV51293.1 4'-phosphopantetheinyl transferase superfamily protein [Streptomyces californicus]